MPHHCARLIAVAIAAVSFSTPITAQQEPTSPPTVETLVETLRGNVNQNEQGEVVEVYLSRTRVTDATWRISRGHMRCRFSTSLAPGSPARVWRISRG